jgi:catechol 2,3-dioxygenase-like lactoylglutathione lyase family enzyme
MGVSEVVPFFAVKDMAASVAFYVDGLGFAFKNKWVDGDVLWWCHLQIGGAGLMLQQFRAEGHDSRQFSNNKGEGVSLCFFCDDAVAFYRDVKSRGIAASEPRMGNGMWVTQVTDPDGYALFFESPMDVAEDTRLSEVG